MVGDRCDGCLAPGVTILGTGAGCGKTWHAVGLLMALWERGHHPVPFKAVTVVDLEDSTSQDPRPWTRAIHHHLMAAGVPYSPHFNPVAVVPTGPRAGVLYLLGEPRGEVGLIAADQVDVGAMSHALYTECAGTIETSLTVCRRQASFVVVEGAGDAGRRSARPDLANVVAPVSAGFPVVAVFRPDRSMYPTLSEFRARIPPQLGGLAGRLIVNNPGGCPLPCDAVRSNLPVASIGPCELPPADGTIARQRARNRALAGHVWSSIPWIDWLSASLHDLRSAEPREAYAGG
jgi:hypothetical protein